ncbi:MAG: hypothetical protein AAF490_31060 [Chloroflexota bacterium]
MNTMTGIIDRLRNLFLGQQTQDKPNNQGQLPHSSSVETTEQESLGISEEVVFNLMKQVQNTKEGEYSCEESYALLDEYVELVVSNEDVERLMPLVKAHIEACPDCKLEFDILLNVLETEE